MLIRVLKKCALYLEGLGQGTGSFIFQAVPPGNEHSQFEWSSVC